MVDFSKLRQAKQSSLEKLAEQVKKVTSNEQSGSDTRIWKPTVDKSGNGMAVIRFLPAPGEEDLPFVKVFRHAFKGPTGLWYIENSLTTLGEPDPVSEFNSKLWNSTDSDDSPARKQARNQKRKLVFVSNIYVVKDPANPSNEGKVFLYEYGKKIFDKVNEALNPQFEDEARFDPFNLWTGANFRLKIRKVEGYSNYDKSEFDSVGPLFDDDTKLEQVWKMEYPLQEFLQKSNFKEYTILKERLDRVLDLKSEKISPSRPKAKLVEEDDIPFKTEPTIKNKKETSPIVDDDDLSFFEQLGSED